MIKKIIKLVFQPVRSLLGTERIVHHFESGHRELLKELKMQKHELDKVTSYIEFAALDTKRMKESDKYRNFHEIIPLLSPVDISGAKYRRLGRNYDGGYVMLDDFNSHHIEAAYSFGISDDVSWDEAIAEFKIDVFMYDHTIEFLSKEHSRFRFFKKGVTGDLHATNLETLSTIIAQNGHQKAQNLILKMDIEGSEWGVFQETPSDVINQFSQIVIELHGLDPSGSSENVAKILSVLKKINQTHQSVHVHANGCSEISWLGEQALPHLLEVTYVRRADYAGRFVPNERTFPTKLDRPTFPWLPDVALGTFTVRYDREI